MTAMSVSEALNCDHVVGVSNIIYGLGVEVDASVCFGMLATQYVNDLMPHYTIFNEEV